MAGAGFDINEYFRRQADAALDTGPLSSELAAQEMEEKSRRKAEALAQRSTELRARMEHNKSSLVAQEGVDPDSWLGQIRNTQASLASGTGRVVGDIAALPLDAYSMANELGVSDAEFEAFSRYEKGEASEQDMALLQQRNNTVLDSDLPEVHPLRQTARAEARNETAEDTPTTLERLKKARASRFLAGGVDRATDFSDLVHITDREKTSEDLARDGNGIPEIQKGWSQITEGDEWFDGRLNMLKGVSKALSRGIETIANNPQAVLEYTVENLPQLLLAGKARNAFTASQMGYASDLVRKGIENYQRDNDGAMPPSDVRERIIMNAVGAGLADTAGDLTLVGRALPKGMREAERASLKKALLGSARGTAAGTASEGATEGYQTYAEGEATLRPADAQEIYEGAVIGSAVGGTVSGAGRVAQEAAKLASQAQADQQEAQAAEDDHQAQFRQAAQTGDPGNLATPGHKSYDPRRAVTALHAFAEQEGRSEEEAQQARQRADEVVATLNENVEARRNRVESFSEEGMARTEQAIARAREQGQDDVADLLQEDLEEVRQLPENEKKREKARLERDERLLSEVTEAQAIMRSRTQNSEPEVQSTKATIEAVRTGDTEAGSRLTALAMEQPDSLDLATLDQLVDDDAAGLSAPQRDYLKRFSAARQAENRLKSLDGVRSNIIKGGPGFVGTQQYRQRIGNALNNNRPEVARTQLERLERFAEQHAAKAEAATSALADAKSSGRSVNLLYSQDQGWQRVDRRISKREQEENGGLVIKPTGSDKLVESIQEEVPVVQSAAEELRSAYTAATQTNTGTTEGTDTVEANTPATGQNPRPADEAGAETETATETPTPASATNSRETSSLPTEALVQRDPIASLRNTARTFKRLSRPIEEGQESQAEADYARAAKQAHVTLTDIAGNERYSEAVRRQAQDALDQTFDRATSLPVSGIAEGQVADSLIRVGKQLAQEESQARKAKQANKGQASSDITTRQASQAEASRNAATAAAPRAEGETARSSEPTPEAATETRPSRLRTLTDATKQVSGTAKQEVFKDYNLIQEYFTQRKPGSQPLVEDGNFADRVLADVRVANQYLQEEMTQGQENLVEAVAQGMNGWRSALQRILPSRQANNAQYDHRDPIRFLLDEEGRLDPNVENAIMAGAMQWLIESGGSRHINTDEMIHAILGRKNETGPASAQERRVLADKGQWDRMVHASIGARIYQALGLRVAKNAPKNLQPQLESSLGLYATALLLDQGVLVRNTVPSAEMQSLRQRESSQDRQRSTTGDLANQGFIQLWQDEAGQPHPAVSDLVGWARGTQGVLPKLFGMEDRIKGPSFEAPTEAPKKTRRTSQGVPSRQQQILIKDSSRVWRVKPNMQRVFSALPNEALEKIAGVVDTNAKRLHKANQNSVEGKNDALRRELSRYSEFVGTLEEREGLATPFHFDHFVAKQQRVHYDANLVNPQSSKIQRHMMAMDGWSSEVSLGDAEQVDSFLLAVADGLDIDTDKQPNVKSLAQVRKALESSVMQGGIVALMKSLNGEVMSQSDIDAIVTAVEEGGANFHTLDALTAYAEFRQAQDQGQETFTTSLMREVDGITNGPILAQLMMGAADSPDTLLELLKKGGFFAEDAGESQYSAWRDKAGNQDLYETMAADVLASMKASLQENPHQAPVYNAIQHLTGPLYNKEKGKLNRGLVKTPLTAMVFGSGIGKAVRGMGEDLEGMAYDAIQDIANDSSLTREQQDTQASLVLEALDVITQAGDMQQRVNFQVSLDQAMTFEMTDAQRKALVKGFKNSMGQDIHTALTDRFGGFIESRNKMTAAAGTAFQVYNLAREHMRRDLLDQLMERGEIPYREVSPKDANGKAIKGADKIREPLQDLSEEQEKAIDTRLKAIFPVMHTAMSKASKDLSSGLFAGKRKTGFSEAHAYSSVAKFGSPVAGQNSMMTRAMSQELTDPGVAMLIMAIHSSDSAISMLSYEKEAALNMHDANGAGINKIREVAKNLNQATFNVMASYSAPTEITDMLQRTLTNFRQAVGDPNSDPFLREGWKKINDSLEERLKQSDQQTKGAVAEQVKSQANRLGVDMIGMSLLRAREEANRADRIKREAMGRLTYVDQYGMEGGNYAVTEMDRARLAKLSKQSGRKIQEAMDELRALAGTQVTDAEAQTQAAEMVEQAQPEAEPESMPAPTQSEIAAMLAQQAAWLEGKLRQQRRNGQELSKAERVQLGRVRKIAEAYRTTGSLEQAVSSAIKDADQAKAWKQRILARTRQQSPATRGIDALPLNDIRTLVSEYRGEDTTLREGLAAFSSSLTVTQDPQEALAGLPVRQRQAVQGYLERGANSVRRSFWGEIGPAAVASDPEILSLLANKEVQYVSELIPSLQSVLASRSSDKTTAFYREVLGAIGDTIDPSLEVRLLTEQTPAEPMYNNRPGKHAMGWFDPSKAHKGLYFKGPDFAASGLSMELMLHEMMHASVSTTIQAEMDKREKNPRYRSEALELVEGLEDLLRDARARVNADANLKVLYSHATSNVHELVSYGMSNPDFQQRVLMPLKASSQARKNMEGNRFITGMQRLIDAITGLLFKGSKKNRQARQRTGVSTLVAHTAGLMQAAQEARQQQTESTRDPLEQRLDDIDTEVSQYTTQDIFRALRRDDEMLSPADERHLSGLLDQLVAKLHGPAGTLKDEAFVAETPEDMFTHALANDRMPFASRTLAAGFRLTDQEAFVLEQVEATIQAGLDSEHTAYRELSSVWRQAREELKGKIPQHQYDYLFTLSDADPDGRSAHLSRFAAVAMVHGPIREKLAVPTPIDNRQLRDMKLGEAILAIFERLVNLLNGKLTRTYQGQQADAKVNTLVQQLVDIEARKRQRLARQEVSLMERAEDGLQNISEGVRKKIQDLAGSDWARNRRSGYAKAVFSLASTVAGDRADEMMNHIERLRDQHFRKRQGVVASVISEMRGAHDNGTQTSHQLLREVAKANEHARLQAMDATKNNVLASFENEGRDLTGEEKESLTRTLLHTGMADLLDHYSMAELTDMVANPQALSSAIREWESQLSNTGSLQAYYQGAARDLAYHMATGINVSDNLMLNAHNIAYLAGTSRFGSISDAQAEAAMGVLDPLISLYALKYTDEGIKAGAHRVMRRELARGNKNAAEGVLRLARHMQQESLDTLFEGSPVHMQKGYTAEILDHYKSVKIATLEEGKQLQRMGWSQGAIMSPDPADPDQTPKAFYVIRDGGQQSYLTGNLSLTGQRARGTELHSGVRDRTGEGVNRWNQGINHKVAQKKARQIDKMFQRSLSYDPAKEKKSSSRLAPVLNQYGDIINYRYMMTEENKDSLLGRNSRIEDVMGAMAGALFDKPASKEQNREVIEALHEQFQAEYAERPEAYLEVSAASSDPRLKEAWDLLPEDAQKTVREVWGRDAMMVRSDQVDITFGYRKASITDMFHKDPAERNALEQVTVDLVAWAASVGRSTDDRELEVRMARVARRLRQAEDIWQAAVKEVKDILVVKNVVTLMGNISSNISLLLWAGVPVKDLVRNHRIALDSVVSYRRDRSERDRLQQMLDAGMIEDGGEVRQRMQELDDALARNKARELIEAGMLPTIVEDVDMHDDPFSYQSIAAEKLAPYTARIPAGVRTAGKWLYMSHDTPIYKILSQGTQLSDFVARYTAFEHLTTRKKNPLSREEALQQASDMFINYDVPTHRTLQYLNDMGLLMFTKYYLRIQKTIMHLYRDKPGRALALTAMTGFLPGLPVLMDSQLWSRSTSPLRSGALEYPASLDELATVKAAMSPFN